MKRDFFLRAGLLLALSTGFPAVVWAGVNCWSTNGPFREALGTVVVDPQEPTTIYACGYGGIWKSRDAGMTWESINSGIPPYPSGDPADIGSLLIDPSSPSTLYAGGDRIYKSINGGASWFPSDDFLPPDWHWIFMNPSDPQTLFAVSYSSLFKSTNGAATWHRSMGGLPRLFYLFDIAWDPADPATLYAATTVIDLYMTGVVFKSEDGGTTWEALGAPFPPYSDVYAVIVDPEVPSTLYVAGGVEWDCIFKSTDSGSTWRPMNTGIPSESYVFSLAMDPADSQVLYATAYTATPDWGSSGGVFRTTDGGATWAAIHQGLPKSDRYIEKLVIDPLDPAHLYIAYTSVYSITLAPVAGDCDGDFKVSIGEVQRAVTMFLDLQAPGCGVDTDGDGIVSIGEVQTVINGFLGVVYPCP